MNSGTFRQKKKKKKEKKKKKRKIRKFKEPCFPNTVSYKFQQIVLKICNTIFSIPFFFVSFVLNFFQKFYCLCYLFESTSELESSETYCLNLPFNGTLKPPKNITQLNTKLGSSDTHFNKFYSLQIPLYWNFTF